MACCIHSRTHASFHLEASRVLQHSAGCSRLWTHLEGLPSLGRACDVHNSPSTQHIVWIPYLDPIKAHHLGVLESNLLDLTPVIADEQRVSHVVGMHNEEKDDALVHVAQGIAKHKDKGEED